MDFIPKKKKNIFCKVVSRRENIFINVDYRCELLFYFCEVFN